MKRIMVRGVMTLVLLALWGWLEGLVNVTSPLMTGTAATWQFENSNAAYIASQYGMKFTPIMNGVIDLLMVLVLVLMWWGIFRSKKATAAVIAALVLGFSSQSWAYYASTDYAEVYTILPNESAFLIPDVGSNRDTQAAFGSVDYLRNNKVALKRVQIPHVKLEGSGYFANQVVPSARLILVDRAPYQREWSADPGKGTSQKNEGFKCESKDSIAITTAITIAAYVTEDDAPQFLYHFGVNAPKGKRDDPNVIFASVLDGRSLEQVMDSNVRGKVHAALCNEMGKLDLDSVFDKKSDIIDRVEKSVRDTYKPMGITLEYIGFADELGYDKEIQIAINRVYISKKNAAAALNLQPAMPVLQQEADMDIKRGLAAGLGSKGLPNLPSFMLVNRDLVDMLGSWFKSDYQAIPKAVPKP